jgi:DNA-binding transcriptional MerR regulator
MHPYKEELDVEWILLLQEAKRLGLSSQVIRKLLQQQKQPEPILPTPQ